MVFLACVHLALFLALSLSPGNSLASSWMIRDNVDGDEDGHMDEIKLNIFGHTYKNLLSLKSA